MKKADYILFVFLLILAITGLAIHMKLQTQPVAAASQIQDSRDTVALPILMYHGITDDKSRVSEYFILDDTLEADLKWLKDNGYTTVSMGQLLAYVEDGAKLPEKPVLLTFDDGFCNNYTLAFPLLQKYHAHAVISIIGAESDISSNTIYRDSNHCNVSWGEVSLLSGSGLVEIGNHTYDLHKTKGKGGRVGADKLKGESMEAYGQVLTDDLGKNQSMIETATGHPALVFAWPFGAYPTDGSANQILKDLGFRASLTSYQKMNQIEKGNPDSLFSLKRFLRTPDFDLAAKLTETE
ncbi:MAG: polysaccharide deacetylase family protein [Firmicutes bacterium]|nr:polysaccharide deacetylase family protein [Bacillota bacterium]